MSRWNAILVLWVVACSGKAIDEKMITTRDPETGAVAVRVIQAGVHGATDSSSMMSERDLVGTYILGAGLTANVTLRLDEFGTYSETTQDCVARPISGSGTWRLTEDGVVLQPDGGRGANSPVPTRRLALARDADTLFLVGDDCVATLLIGGAPGANCFKRQGVSTNRTVARRP